MNAASVAAAIREALEYAPPSGPTAPDLVAVRIPNAGDVCAPCVGRIIARGCGHTIRAGAQVWAPSPMSGACIGCGRP